MSKSARNKQRKEEQERLRKSDLAKICGATTKAKKICLRQAGYGTDHPGSGRCKFHTGSTRSGKLAAAREQMNGMAVARSVTPSQAIQAALSLSAGHLAYTTEQVSQLSDDELFAMVVNRETGIPQIVENYWMTLQKEAMKDVARFAKLAHDMGISERGMNLKEMQTQMMAQMLQGVLGELGLTAAQKKKVAPAIREVMRRSGSPGDEQSPEENAQTIIDAEPAEVLG